MEARSLFLLLVIFAVLSTPVIADFFYNPNPPKLEELEGRGLKCVPGRTVIKISQNKNLTVYDTEEEGEFRRSHMNYEASDELCEICVCSVEGKDEYCSKRPARNINECIRMADLKEKMQKQLPYGHDRALAYRIRRDYIWHRDEIPYEARSKCLRGTSYYSNSLNANDTDIDVASEIESLLDYDNIDICFFCVCSVDARAASCINRDPWFCEYYRIIKEPDAMRHKYARLFQQDRPAYFRHLSHRLRRTMDDSMFALIDKVGDKDDDSKCIPFVSEYSDCTDANMCTGCTKCYCADDERWSCKDIISCPDEGEADDGDNGIYNAVDVLFSDVKERDKQRNKKMKQRFVPLPPKPEEDVLLGDVRYKEDFEAFLTRYKRSVDQETDSNDTENNTVKFFNTLDELNEDTLKNSNQSGTIEAQKINPNINISRRKGMIDGINKTDLSSLHIEYNPPQDLDHQIAENKIDAFPHDDQTISLDKEPQNLIANFSQSTKDKNLSKIVVNELKQGREIIGDKNVIPMSNITFTPENDTLTAMAFIAGNLLNKLWNMDKETSDSLETETLKHEKINDLLDLFKEPLNLRQETFLKNALEKLSNSLNTNKNIQNVSICETFDGSNLSRQENETPGKNISTVTCNKNKKTTNDSKNTKNLTSDVMEKLTDVLNLIKKFENTQSALNSLKRQTHNSLRNEPVKVVASEKNKFNLFASILEKITKLLLPSKHSHKIHKKMNSVNQYIDDESFRRNLKIAGQIDLSNMTVTTKDKIVLDYINHIQRSPGCLLKKLTEKSDGATLSFKGEIIDRLTEFLKIKSFVDLSKLLETKEYVTTSTTSTTSQPSTVTSSSYESIRKSENQEISKVEKLEVKKLATAKERLKLHLKSIVNDLAELQKGEGNKINITDLMPCISNILGDKTKTSEKISIKESDKESTPIENIEYLISALKLEFKPYNIARRSGSGDTVRSTSAKVWKRVVTNVNEIRKQNTRRFDANKPKSYSDLKKMVDKIEKLSNSYKNFALLSVVQPHKKLMLLKTLEADVAKHKNILKNIKNSYETIETVSHENRKELLEFIDNTATNIKLSNNVLLNLNKNTLKPRLNNSNTKFAVDILPNQIKMKSNYKMSQKKKGSNKFNLLNNVDKNFKLSKDQIINQLITNRLQLYLKLQEEEGVDSNDINYSIAKKALINLRSGKDSLGRELFNILVQNKNIEGINQTRRTMPYKARRRKGEGSVVLYSLKEPLLKITDPRTNIAA